MGNEAAYSCAALLFLVLVVLFAVSFRTSSQTRKYCQSGGTPPTPAPPSACYLYNNDLTWPPKSWAVGGTPSQSDVKARYVKQYGTCYQSVYYDPTGAGAWLSGVPQSAKYCSALPDAASTDACSICCFDS